MSDANYEIRRLRGVLPNGTYDIIKIGAGRCTLERIVPPAGERYAFTLATWATNVEITVSPTGRSVQVHVNGERVA